LKFILRQKKHARYRYMVTLILRVEGVFGQRYVFLY